MWLSFEFHVSPGIVIKKSKSKDMKLVLDQNLKQLDRSYKMFYGQDYYVN